MTLAAEAVSVVQGRRQRLCAASLALRPGELLALVGPNAAGKSTLLEVLAGTLAPNSGRVTLDGRPLARWPAQALARRRAVLPQYDALTFPFRVEEVVALAFTPYRDFAAAAHVRDSLQRLGVAHLMGRTYTELSGGERRRVQLARVIAQLRPAEDPSATCLLLDEPTAALDLAQQHAVMRSLRALTREGGSVLAVVHDLGLAARYADRLAVMAGGRLRAVGGVDQVLEGPLLGEVFGVDVRVERSADGLPLVAVRTPA